MFSWLGGAAEKVCIESRSLRDWSGSSSEYRDKPKIYSPAYAARSVSGRVNASDLRIIGGPVGGRWLGVVMLPACPRDSGLVCRGGRRGEVLWADRPGD